MSAAYGGEAAAAAAAAIANAVKATGAIVRVSPDEFSRILARIEQPVIVTGKGGFMWRKFQYMTNYKGFFFFTQADRAMQLPYKAEIIAATSIWIPR